METQLCLLLTGTIAPQDVPNLERTNINDREADYHNAISAWLTLGVNLVFCENSGYYSEKLEQLFRKSPHAEYIKFKTLVSHLGKGKGEAEIMTFAFANSQLLKNAVYVCKVTGRYNVANFNNISRIVLASDFDISANFTQNLTWVDSRFIIFKPHFYQQYLSYHLSSLDENNSVFFEHCLAKAIHQGLSERLIFIPLPELPIYEGVYATSNLLYKNNFIHRMKYKIFSRLKKFFFESKI